MSTKTRDLLALANQLQNQAGNEASLRCAISRAYYAALHETKNVFDARPRIGVESSHNEIIGRAVAHGNSLQPGRQAAAQIAQMLPKMRRTRNQADYDLDDTITGAETRGVIERAERVMQLCEEIKTKRQQAA